jgi:hypothetical protein
MFKIFDLYAPLFINGKTLILIKACYMGFLMLFQIGFKSVAFFTAISLLRNELKTSKLNKKQQKPYLVRDWMFLVGPRMVLPRGVCWYATACK